MNTTRRRSFLGAALAGSAALVARGKSAAVEFHPGAMRPAQAPDSRVEILTGEPIAKISPDLYGHFVEHLGGVAYDGIWVGEDAKVRTSAASAKSLLSIWSGSRRASCAGRAAASPTATTGAAVSGRARHVPGAPIFWRYDRGNRASEAYRRLDSGPQKHEPNWVRHQRIHPLLQADRCTTIPGGQLTQSAGASVLASGRVLQRPG